MELINRQDAIDGLLEDVPPFGLMDAEGNIECCCKDKDVIAMVESLQSIEAIPIEWISNKAKSYEHSDNSILQDGAFILNILIDDWKEEQEKEK